MRPVHLRHLPYKVDENFQKLSCLGVYSVELIKKQELYEYNSCLII